MTNDKFKPIFNKESFVPKTYEQFVLEEQNLTNQQDLYPDLVGGDIGIQKGYGPCESGGCSYSNAECQCYIGECRVPMYLACPVPKYQAPYYCTDDTAGQWYHNNCGGRMFIDVNLNIKCMSCQTSGYVESWTFTCSSHPGKYEYASRSEFKNALGYLNNIWKNNYAGRRLIEKMIDKAIDARSFKYD